MRPGLTLALDRSREKAGQQAKSSEPWALACTRHVSLATNSAPARAAGTPFLGSAARKEQSSVPDLAQGVGSWSKATAGTGLTIRSSRDRFAASCKSANFHLHKAAKRPVLTQALCVVRRGELILWWELIFPAI